jgi:hypothetical protein
MNLSLARFGFQAIGIRELGEAFLRMGRRDPKTRRGKVLCVFYFCWEVGGGEGATMCCFYKKRSFQMVLSDQEPYFRSHFCFYRYSKVHSERADRKKGKSTLTAKPHLPKEFQSQKLPCLLDYRLTLWCFTC